MIEKGLGSTVTDVDKENYYTVPECWPTTAWLIYWLMEQHIAETTEIMNYNLRRYRSI